MPKLKNREIENLEQMTAEELESFIATLPAGQATISALLDFVEDELYENECDHSLRFAMKFMMDNRLDFPKLTTWLSQNGGYCDCKVLAEIAPAWRAKFGDD